MRVLINPVGDYSTQIIVNIIESEHPILLVLKAL